MQRVSVMHRVHTISSRKTLLGVEVRPSFIYTEIMKVCRQLGNLLWWKLCADSLHARFLSTAGGTLRLELLDQACTGSANRMAIS